MKAEFEYTEDEIKEIVLKHHLSTWGNFTTNGKWVAEGYYSNIRIILKEKEIEEDIV
jgi:hypothetical protein